jgi:hypothetical protein
VFGVESKKKVRALDSRFKTMKRTGFITRRLFLRWLLGVPLLSVCPFLLSEAKSQMVTPPGREKGNSIGEFYKGEELDYEIGFWLIRRAALGHVSFKGTEKKGRYQAILQTETLGVLGWIARYRVDTYRSTMEEIDGGKRLRSLSFEENVKVGGKARRMIHLFDYEKRKWTVLKQRKDETMARSDQEIPEGMVYDDFLTAVCNFSYGVYGAIERGKTYTISTFPRKKATHYEIRVAPKEEEERKRQAERSKEGKDLFVGLRLDPEITHSKEGIIEGWLSEDLCPMEGVIKDVDIVGDVKGRLIRRART